MFRKSDKEFWAGRMQRRYHIHNLVTGEKCELSAGSYNEALANLKWERKHCIYVFTGIKQQLAEPKWYVRDATQSRKDKENE